MPQLINRKPWNVCLATVFWSWDQALKLKSQVLSTQMQTDLLYSSVPKKSEYLSLSGVYVLGGNAIPLVEFV